MGVLRLTEFFKPLAAEATCSFQTRDPSHVCPSVVMSCVFVSALGQPTGGPAQASGPGIAQSSHCAA